MLELLASHVCHRGEQRFYRHESARGRVPGLFYLAGLTCTEETFPIKAGAQRFAAQYGIALISPDTSPRGAGIPGESEGWDFGVGAGFYVDVTREPWSRNYRMYSYVRDELRETVLANLPVDGTRLGIFGHSMGGHGALVLALRNPEIYRSVSAFAPIAAPMRCPWGERAFVGYLGDDRDSGRQYDASQFVASATRPLEHPILIDQGLADQFPAEQLYPDVFDEACARAGQSLTLRRYAGYDHGYYFIQTFVGEHIAHHASILTYSQRLSQTVSRIRADIASSTSKSSSNSIQRCFAETSND